MNTGSRTAMWASGEKPKTPYLDMNLAVISLATFSTADYTIEAKFKIVNEAKLTYVLGYSTGGDNGKNIRRNTQNKFVVAGEIMYSDVIDYDSPQILKIDHATREVSYNGVLFSMHSAIFQRGLWCFGSVASRYSDSNYNFVGRLYSIKVYNEDETIGDYIPREVDGVAGLYNRIDNTFHGNTISIGTITYGEEDAS